MLSVYIGGNLAVSGASKLRFLTEPTRALQSQIRLSARDARAIVRTLAFVELGVGLGVLATPTLPARLAAVVLYGSFAVWSGTELAKHRISPTAPCGCMGKSEFPDAGPRIVLNVIWSLSAAWLAFRALEPSASSETLLYAVGACVVVATACAYAAVRRNADDSSYPAV